MSFQPWQLTQLVFFVVMAVVFWKIHNKYARIVIVVFAFIVFAMNPIRVKQKGVVQLEGGGPDFKVEERWNDKGKSFKQKQTEELSQLKEESDNAMD
ncbi:MAG: hypothetical protein JSV82_02105 [Planctomycetota bacterium]|nr:MAG: hypothetical protein JSV82_02105 [Planctomycetota bacterium]